MRFELLAAVNMNLRAVVSCRLRTFIEVINRQQTCYLSSPGQNTGSKTLVHIYQTARYISTKLHGTQLANYTVHIYQIARYIATKLHGTYLPNNTVNIYQITQYISTKLHGTYLPNYTVHIYQTTWYHILRITLRSYD